MRRILAIVLLLSPMLASADHLDVIEFKLNPGCSFDKYMAIVKDFNQWGAKNGYRAEVLTPIQSNNLTSMYWAGRSKDAATFGKAWDTWRNAQADATTVEAKLEARFEACSTNLSRRGYDTY
jgi:hypothetical protein